MKLSNGEYEVHNIGVNWPHHIFELSPPPELALDAFHHPYVYAHRARPYYEDVHLAAPFV